MGKYRITFAIVVFGLFVHLASAQTFSATAGLGLEYYNAPSLSRYFASTTGGITPGTYVTSVQLVAGLDCFIASEWTIGIEYAYLTNQTTGNGIQINYSYSLPTLMLRKVVEGENYYLRVGGGIGYHGSSLSQLVSYGATDYFSSGLGFKFDAALDTKLNENFYARVTIDGRGEFTGILKTANGTALTGAADSREINSNLSGVGVTFGLVYYF